MSGYFLYHSIGTFPGKSRAMSAALAHFSEVWSAEDDGQWPAALAARHTFIEYWERLIGATPGTLTTAENVTAALYSLIGSFPPSYLKGRRISLPPTVFRACTFCWPSSQSGSVSNWILFLYGPEKLMCATRTLWRAGMTMSA